MSSDDKRLLNTINKNICIKTGKPDFRSHQWDGAIKNTVLVLDLTAEKIVQEEVESKNVSRCLYPWIAITI